VLFSGDIKMKIVYYLAISLDGFIAEEDGGVTWLDGLSIDYTNTGYESFYESVDGLIMGRNTYDFVHNSGQWPYGGKPTWVCTTQALSTLDGCNLQPGSDARVAIAEAKSMGLNNVWVVGGGVLAGSLLNLGLLTHISTSVMPIVLGKGIKLFDSLSAPVQLHQESSTLMSGFTQLEFRVGT
jgi:dihydrofolate reductase